MNTTTTQTLNWVAQSKARPKITFEGKARGTTKEILRTVKTQLITFAVQKKAKNGEAFKVSLVKNGNTVDAWVMKAKATTTTRKNTVTKPTVLKTNKKK